MGMQWWTLQRPVPPERYSSIPTPERGNDDNLFQHGCIAASLIWFSKAQ